ncbi:DUF4912 domain-containing protein [Okeania sp. KiyG1]|uniref:DUF4912 domain-containing protein n=1 Tax=Okeania sp. KiyG1 TaxID=2720165 RepID=UPI0019249534|nr:DUF4912 domain-containing protein [Okeania sp. KiyG1]GGA05319.1 hypothetical protein CYANOKiyG1_17540 [Okeania sp. KiyG1]
MDGDESIGVSTPEAGVDTTETPTTTVDETPTDGIGVAPIVGGLGLAGLLVAWANQAKNSEINLTAQPNQTALATWSVPEADKDAAKSLGGKQYQLRVYDVTDIELDSQPAPSVQQYDCSESTTDKELENLAAEHEYQAEIGYVTDDGHWLKLARSEKIRILTAETVITVDGDESIGVSTPEAGVDTKETPTTTVDETPTDGIPIAPIVGGLGLAGLLIAWANQAKNSEINLTAQPNQTALATWSVPEADKDAAKSLGGKQYQLRVYDVTDIELDSQPAPSVQQYDCSESTTDKELENLAAEHEYQAEIGYVTDDGHWLKLARSEKIRILTAETVTTVDGDESIGVSTPEAGVDTKETPTTTVDETPTDGIGVAPIVGGLGLAGLLVAWANQAKNSEINLTAQPNQTALATWSVPQADKDAAKSYGGKQYQLRVYDVTDIDLDSQPAPSVQQYDCSESTTDKELENLAAEHEYQAEIGYVTDDGEWLKLARSEKLRISTAETVRFLWMGMKV